MSGAEDPPDVLQTLAKQLTLEFEELPQQEIEDSIVKRARAYESARVRTFVPLLVERETRDELRRARAARSAS